MTKHVFILFLTLSFCGCDRLDGLNEGDRNTYTWKGTIYEGFSDEPLRHQSVYLEASYFGVPVGKTEVIGETTTDENGYYSITYRRIRGAVENVNLYIDNSQFSNSPIKTTEANTNFETDLSSRPHVRISLLIHGDLDDTLIVQPLSLLESDYSSNSNFEPSIKGKYLVIPKSLQSDVISYKADITAINEDGSVPTFFRYGIGRKDWNLASNAHKIDSIDDSYNRLSFDARGFPFSDTIALNLND